MFLRQSVVGMNEDFRLNLLVNYTSSAANVESRDLVFSPTVGVNDGLEIKVGNSI